MNDIYNNINNKSVYDYGQNSNNEQKVSLNERLCLQQYCTYRQGDK